MNVDPHTPVLVGAGQISQRTDRGEPELEPVQVMAAAARLAAADAGVPLDAVDSLRIGFSLSAMDRNVPLAVSAELGVEPGHRRVVLGGGELGAAMVAGAAADVAAGRHEMVLLTTGEAWRTKIAAQRAGRDLAWRRQGEDVPPAETIGDVGTFVTPHEEERGLVDPVEWYSLFEHALRGRAGRGVAEHRAFLGRLWEGFSEVARQNPYAWDQTPYGADDIASPGPGNRLVASPYTKLLCSNEQVDQGAALLVTSAERARALGIDPDRWVFPVAAAQGKALFMSERMDLADSPLAAAIGEELTALAGWAPADADLVDLYSCFPSAVQLQAAGLGFGLDRPLTVTGGMRFAGGPWCGYPVHALATLVGLLRGRPGARAVGCANGGAVTKLCALALSADPPAAPFRIGEVTERVAAGPRRTVETSPSGQATVETYTIAYGRGGEPTKAVLACLLPDERRTWGVVRDAGSLDGEPDLLGRTVTLTSDGRAELD